MSKLHPASRAVSSFRSFRGRRILMTGVVIVIAFLVLSGARLRASVQAPTLQAATEATTTVSFSSDIVPIFTGSGCTACHLTGSHQCDLNGSTDGHLYLDGGGGGPFNQLVNEPNNAGCSSAPTDIYRVDVCNPEASLLLRKPTNPQQNRPGDGSPPSPDVHEGGTILTKRDSADCQVGELYADEAYCKMLRWIQEGASNNRGVCDQPIFADGFETGDISAWLD